MRTFVVFTALAFSAALAGCMAPPTQQENIQQAQQLNAQQVTAAEQAHETCVQFGAQPGTRMFYNCMKEQTEAAQYRVALAACKSEGYSRQSRLECIRGGAGLFGMRSCLAHKEQECEKSAQLAYLPDSTAQKIERYNHNYDHTYSHTYGPSPNP